MPAPAVILALVLAAVAIIATLLAFRRRPGVATVPSVPHPWTDEAGTEFAGLSEAARCEMAFALSALDDPESLDLLESALSDPSEAVALAAAHALARRGGVDRIERYFNGHSGERTRRLEQTLRLLDSGA